MIEVNWLQDAELVLNTVPISDALQFFRILSDNLYAELHSCLPQIDIKAGDLCVEYSGFHSWALDNQ